MLQPKLRFKEFSEKWEEKSLNSIFERIIEKNTENNKNYFFLLFKLSLEKLLKKIKNIPLFSSIIP